MMTSQDMDRVLRNNMRNIEAKRWQERQLREIFGSAEPQSFKTIELAELSRRIDMVEEEFEKSRRIQAIVAWILFLTCSLVTFLMVTL